MNYQHQHQLLLPSEQRVQRAAMALNNEAVSLLQQGYFVAAKQALNSTISMMETLLLNNSMYDSLDDEEEDDDDETLEENDSQDVHMSSSQEEKLLLWRSLEYSQPPREMAHPSPLSTTTTATTTTRSNIRNSTANSSPRLRMLPFEIHLVEDMDLSTMRSALQYGCSPSVFFFVVLREACPLEATASSDKLDLQTISRQYASVLYNTAVAYLLCHEHDELYGPRELVPAAATTAKDTATSLSLNMARQLLACAKNILSSLAHEMMKHQTTQQLYCHSMRAQLMLVTGLALNCHSLVCWKFDQRERGVKVLQTVEKLSEALDQHSFLFVPTRLAPAA